MLHRGYRKIDGEDLDLFVVTDSLAEAIEVITKAAPAPDFKAIAEAGQGIRPTLEGTIAGRSARIYPEADNHSGQRDNEAD
jgi:hypothetical protein